MLSQDISNSIEAGTANIGTVTVDGFAVALPAGANNIGDVDVLSLPALPAGTNNIGDVDVLTLPALVAGEAMIGKTGGNTVNISSTPVVSASAAYTSGDNVGGKPAIAAARLSGGSGSIRDLIVWDKDNQKAAFEILVFNATPPNGTYTDNAAMVAAGDHGEYIGKIIVGASDYITTGAVAIAQISNLDLPFVAVGSANLYYAIKTTSTPTYTTTSGLVLKFGIYQD